MHCLSYHSNFSKADSNPLPFLSPAFKADNKGPIPGLDIWGSPQGFVWRYRYIIISLSSISIPIFIYLYISIYTHTYIYLYLSLSISISIYLCFVWTFTKTWGNLPIWSSFFPAEPGFPVLLCPSWLLFYISQLPSQRQTLPLDFGSW